MVQKGGAGHDNIESFGQTSYLPVGTDLSIIEGNPGTYILAPGTHVIGAALDVDELSDVHLIGAGFGKTIIQRSADVSFLANSELSPTYYDCDNTVANTYNITTTTAADANNFEPDDTILIIGTWGASQFGILDTVVSVDGDTGVINTVHNISEIFTTVTVGKVNPLCSNFKMEGITFDSNGQSSDGFEMYHMKDCDIDLQFIGQDGVYCNPGAFRYLDNCNISCHSPERLVQRPGTGSGYWGWQFRHGQGGKYFAETYFDGTIGDTPYHSCIHWLDMWRADAKFIAEGGYYGINDANGGFNNIVGQMHDQSGIGFHMYKVRYDVIKGHARDCGTAVVNNGSNYKSAEINN